MSKWLWIGALGLVVLLALLTGVGFVTYKLPQWPAGGKQNA